MVERTAVNPWTWSLDFGFNQGELVEGATRTLYCAGQTSVDENGAPAAPRRHGRADHVGRRQPRGGARAEPG